MWGPSPAGPTVGMFPTNTGRFRPPELFNLSTKSKPQVVEAGYAFVSADYVEPTFPRSFPDDEKPSIVRRASLQFDKMTNALTRKEKTPEKEQDSKPPLFSFRSVIHKHKNENKSLCEAAEVPVVVCDIDKTHERMGRAQHVEKESVQRRNSSPFFRQVKITRELAFPNMSAAVSKVSLPEFDLPDFSAKKTVQAISDSIQRKMSSANSVQDPGNLLEFLHHDCVDAILRFALIQVDTALGATPKHEWADERVTSLRMEVATVTNHLLPSHVSTKECNDAKETPISKSPTHGPNAITSPLKSLKSLRRKLSLNPSSRSRAISISEQNPEKSSVNPFFGSPPPSQRSPKSAPASLGIDPRVPASSAWLGEGPHLFPFSTYGVVEIVEETDVSDTEGDGSGNEWDSEDDSGSVDSELGPELWVEGEEMNWAAVAAGTVLVQA